jgi:hypothetical protein
VAHACISSYAGGRDQEDCGSKPVWANSSGDPISKKNPSEKKKRRVVGVTQGIGPEFKPQYHQPPPPQKKKQFSVEWGDSIPNRS